MTKFDTTDLVFISRAVSNIDNIVLGTKTILKEKNIARLMSARDNLILIISAVGYKLGEDYKLTKIHD